MKILSVLNFHQRRNKKKVYNHIQFTNITTYLPSIAITGAAKVQMQMFCGLSIKK